MISGILSSFADRLLRQPRPLRGALFGQAISVKGGLTPYIAIDADGHLHLLLAPAAADLPRLQRFRRPALDLDNRPWSVSGAPIESYLDLTLVTPTVSPLRRPFLSFCEDILTDIENGLSPEAAVYRTCSRWERFWEQGETAEPSATWVLGLMGELTLLDQLLNIGSVAAVGFWTGPEGADHDFQAGTRVALEVKTSVRMPPVIECGLAQLDSGGAGELLLVVFHATSREDATSLPELVERIEAKLSANEDALHLFLDKLARTGYRRHLVADYGMFMYDLAPPIFHIVDETFPRVTHASFAAPLDARIHSVRYTLELTAIDPIAVDDPRISAALGAFGARL